MENQTTTITRGLAMMNKRKTRPGKRIKLHKLGKKNQLFSLIHTYIHIHIHIHLFADKLKIIFLSCHILIGEKGNGRVLHEILAGNINDTDAHGCYDNNSFDDRVVTALSNS